MEKFYLEEPSIKRKEKAIDYILEHLKYNSDINGTSGLNSRYENYEKWLEYVESMKNIDTCPKDRSPGIEYFLIRENDNKLIGMINLRWNLNEDMLLHAGNIGYGIRPTERRKGYNKINLYLCLLEAQKQNLKRVLLMAYDDNPGSIKTILALGGVLINRIEYKEKQLGRYQIDVDDSLNKYKSNYKKYIKE